MAANGEEDQQIQEILQPAFQQPTTTTTTAGVDTNTQPSRTVNVSQVNLGFAVMGLLLGLSIFILNVVPIGQGIRVNTGYWPGDPNDKSYNQNRSVNYYPGFWYGLLNAAGCLGVIVYYVKVTLPTKKHGAFILDDSTVCSTGARLSTFFGIMAAVGIGAIATSTVTAAVLVYNPDMMRDCKYNSRVSVCYCQSSYWVSGVQSCQYAWGTVFNLYRTLTGIAAILVVIDIVISALFCGVLCCCVAAPMGGQTMSSPPPGTPEIQASHTIPSPQAHLTTNAACEDAITVSNATENLAYKLTGVPNQPNYEFIQPTPQSHRTTKAAFEDATTVSNVTTESSAYKQARVPNKPYYELIQPKQPIDHDYLTLR